MHESREAAAQLALRLFEQRSQDGIDCFREIIRAVEPMLQEGWRRQMDDSAILNPDLTGWDGDPPQNESLPIEPSPSDTSPLDLPTDHWIKLDDD